MLKSTVCRYIEVTIATTNPTLDYMVGLLEANRVVRAEHDGVIRFVKSVRVHGACIEYWFVVA